MTTLSRKENYNPFVDSLCLYCSSDFVRQNLTNIYSCSKVASNYHSYCQREHWSWNVGSTSSSIVGGSMGWVDRNGCIKCVLHPMYASDCSILSEALCRDWQIFNDICRCCRIYLFHFQ